MLLLGIVLFVVLAFVAAFLSGFGVTAATVMAILLAAALFLPYRRSKRSVRS
jgi:hypothetical protein